ncbi:NB-ARC domain-containing protein [Streptomyces rubiginosohelvolus]|uniref:NB-ARC domain-containing protein n=1 Tax=Streptomyces rubiginosohelvolus TaxID=67362 RepID=UPI00339F5988
MSGTHNTVGGGTIHGPVIQAQTATLHFHAAAPVLPLPRQLPPVPVTFTDRHKSVEVLSTWIQEHSAFVRAVTIHGVGGVGKTTLATRLLEALRDLFPAGQLYADLHGTRGQEPRSVLTDVLGQLVRSLHPGPLPTGLEERVARWRSVTAGSAQPLAVLLDNASRADQVRALMPGGRGHLVVVTSREPLSDLARDGVLLHQLDPFAPAAALEYLARFAGQDRVDADRAAAHQIAALSAGLPLALGLVGGELAAHPGRGLGAVANVLQHAHHRTRAAARPPSTTGIAVTSSLDLAYAALPPAPAGLYRCLGLLALTADVDSALAAAVADLPPHTAERELRALCEAGLLTVRVEADPVRGTVYTLHDETRAHARRRAEDMATDGEPEERLRRGLDYLLHTLTAAERILTPEHRRLARTYRYPPAGPVPFTDTDGATAWLTAYGEHFLPAVRTAAAAGLHATTWQLTHALWCWLRLVHDYAAWAESHALALDAARTDGDALAQREILNTWGIGLRGDRHYDAAIETFTEVLTLARAAQDHRGAAQALHEIGTTHLAAGRCDLAGQFLGEARQLRHDLAVAAQDPAERRAHRRSVALTDISLGELALARCQGEEAVARLTTARNALLDLPDPLDAARALAYRGRAHALSRDFPTAEADGLRAIEECTALETPRWRARSTELLGRTVLEAGRISDGHSLLQQARDLFAPSNRPEAERIDAFLRRITTTPPPTAS